MLRSCLAILSFALQMLILTAVGLQIRRNVRKSEHPAGRSCLAMVIFAPVGLQIRRDIRKSEHPVGRGTSSQSEFDSCFTNLYLPPRPIV